jgi:Cyclic nucleotide-binding domain
MFGQISERLMHGVRWVLTIGWLVLIISLFYDPFSPWLTDPNNQLSPFRLNLDACVPVQGKCLPEQPYPMGAEIFWGLVVPSAIFILLVFGHELWRRICPLSFLSQIPRALGFQRQFKRVNEKTGKVRYELAKVKPDSWLGRNFLYLQFGWFFVGLCFRILFVNSDRLALAFWLLFTIGFAIAVGYLYGGKSWCNYFCPMSPVQKIYSEPRGLLGSQAHVGEQMITQSMCRIVDKDGKEQSACVACQSPCIDIDSERTYWDGMGRRDRVFLYYGYLGVVVGYFSYYYLYAGNWVYYFSGAWAHDENQLASLFNPGFYLFGNAIAIPKLVAVPLTLGLSTVLFYFLGQKLEKFYYARTRRTNPNLTKEQVRHRMFSLCTFIAFNFFFIFGGQAFINRLPIQMEYLWEALIIVVSTLWLRQTWGRTPQLYSREGLASRFRKQLTRLNLNVSQYLDGSSLDDLNTHEVYVLAKVLPGFTKEKRHEAYKGVLKEALEEGYADTASSLEVLAQMRAELDISEEEHRQVLDELGIEDPELLNPDRQRSRENLVRLTGYRKALERMLAVQEHHSFNELLAENPEAIKSLRSEYSITSQEQEEILQGFDPAAEMVRRAEFLLSELGELIERYHALNQPILHEQGAVLSALKSAVRQKKRLMLRGFLESLEHLKNDPVSRLLARSLGNLAPSVLQDVLENPRSEWYDRLPAEIIAELKQPEDAAPACSLALEKSAIAGHLEALLHEQNPLIQAISLYMLYLLDEARSRSSSASRSQQEANNLLKSYSLKPFVRNVAETVLSLKQKPENPLAAFSTLEKLVYLVNSEFFQEVNSEMSIEIANLAQIKTYKLDELITEEGDTCRELLLLVEGNVQIEIPHPGGEPIISSLLPGQVLDELEVLTHTQQAGTIVAKVEPTRVLAIPVDSFDNLLDRDRDLARKVLEMESRHLQRALQKIPTSTS